MKKAYLGIDVGSISTNLVLMDRQDNVISELYLGTDGNPVRAVQKGLKQLKNRFKDKVEIVGVGVTGSGRQLIGVITGADLVKNEITAHAVAAMHYYPNVRTVFEIGGQDSKLIVIRNGVVTDFAMNSVCAAGTGAFLDAQATRLKIPIEDFGKLALKSKTDVNIAGRCTVFAESDMVHKQQTGHSNEDIAHGLCNAMVRNYLNNVGKGKNIKPPLVFQGGVSENTGIKKAFEQFLGYKVIVPKHNLVMGAIGMCLLVKKLNPKKSGFLGFEIADKDIKTRSFECKDCPNQCEVIKAIMDEKVISYFNDRCGKYTAPNPA